MAKKIDGYISPGDEDIADFAQALDAEPDRRAGRRIPPDTTLPEAQRIRKFLLLYKELDADDGELTRTRKVRRGVIAEKYADIIDTLYSDRGSVDIDTVIHFQDGSRQRIVTTLKVVDLGAAGDAVAMAAE